MFSFNLVFVDLVISLDAGSLGDDQLEWLVETYYTLLLRLGDLCE